MLNLDLIQQLLIVATVVSVVTCSFIQKTKGLFKNKNIINIYSIIVNILLGVLFCLSFTSVGLYNGIWVGVFSYIGADTLYKSLEGKLKPYSEIVKKDVEIIERIDK